MEVPFIDLTNPMYLGFAAVLLVLCIFLSKTTKTNTACAIAVLSYLTILACHTVELASVGSSELVILLSKNIIYDETLTFGAFLAFLWMDRVEIKEKEKNNKTKKTKKRFEDKVIDDDLDFFFKEV